MNLAYNFSFIFFTFFSFSRWYKLHAILFIGFQNVILVDNSYIYAGMYMCVCVNLYVVIIIKGTRARSSLSILLYHAQFMCVLCTCYPRVYANQQKWTRTREAFRLLYLCAWLLRCQIVCLLFSSFYNWCVRHTVWVSNGKKNANENFFFLFFFFLCILFSTWFIDFLLDIFQDDFYDTSKRARVISNNNKSGTKTQQHSRIFHFGHIISENGPFTWDPTKHTWTKQFRSQFFFSSRFVII